MPMLDEVAALGRRRRARSTTRSTRASGSWASAIASTAPRTRARGSSSGRRRSSARRRSRSPSSSSRPRSRRSRSATPSASLATNVEYYSAVVLDVAEIPPPLAPAMFACSRVAGWSAHILEQKRTGRLFRPSARYVGPADRIARSSARDASPRPRRRPTSWRSRATRARARRPAPQWDDELEAARRARGLPRAGGRLPRDRPVPLPPEDRAAAARARGREPGLPRLGAALARAALARPPGRINAVRPLLHALVNADDNEAVRRLAIVCLRNGSPQRDTIVLLHAIAEDDEQRARTAADGGEGRRRAQEARQAAR